MLTVTELVQAYSIRDYWQERHQIERTEKEVEIELNNECQKWHSKGIYEPAQIKNKHK